MHLEGPSPWSPPITLGCGRDAIDIREFVEDDLEAVVAFSLRAWEPVFASVQAVLGDISTPPSRLEDKPGGERPLDLHERGA